MSFLFYVSYSWATNQMLLNLFVFYEIAFGGEIFASVNY